MDSFNYGLLYNLGSGSILDLVCLPVSFSLAAHQSTHDWRPTKMCDVRQMHHIVEAVAVIVVRIVCKCVAQRFSPEIHLRSAFVPGYELNLEFSRKSLFCWKVVVVNPVISILPEGHLLDVEFGDYVKV